MDKNMVNIDDLLRQRLSNGEEKERQGAWLNMQALLDTNMPTKIAGGYNWRRMLSYTTGLLLLSAVTVGSYQVYTKMRTSSDANVYLASASKNIPVTKNDISFNNTSNTNNNSNSNNNSLSEVAVVAAPATNNNSATGATNGNNVEKQSNSPKNNAISSLSNKENIAHNELKTNKKESIVSSGSVNASLHQANSVAKAETTVNTKTGQDNYNAVVKTATANKPEINVKPAPADNIPTNNSAVPQNTEPKNSPVNDKPVAKQEPNKTGNKTAGTKQGDSAKVLAITEKYERGQGYKIKVEDKGKMALAKEEPLIASNDNTAVASNTVIVPAASVKNETKESEMLPLSQFKVSSKKINTGRYPSRFEEMVKNAKLNLSGVTFHPGIVGGINMSVAGTNSSGGFQAGLTGTAGFSEHWSMFAELKYMQRFGGRKLEDKYNTGLTQMKFLPNNGVEYRYNEVTNTFKYATLSSVHLPLAVKYAINRYSLFCGADFGYNFKVNADNSGSETKIVYQEVPASGEGLNYDNTKTNPSMGIKDFSPRLDMGAMIGGSYNLTPALQLDFRAVQSVWNNANTVGEQKVYEELYSPMSLQFNISYRFSSNKHRPYR